MKNRQIPISKELRESLEMLMNAVVSQASKSSSNSQLILTQNEKTASPASHG
jgi:hypothetical protein